MVKQENKKTRCWYTEIGKCLDFIVPITPDNQYLGKKNKD